MRWLYSLIVIIAMLVSACGSKVSNEKIAVVDWDKVLAAHPKAEQLKQMKNAYDSLLFSRRQQAETGKNQMAGLARLQNIKQKSQQSFLDADFTTKMAERDTVEQESLQKAYNQAVQEAQTAVAGDEQTLEEGFSLRLFNLRLRLETVRLLPAEKEKLLQELEQVQSERSAARAKLQSKKAALVRERMASEQAAKEARMQAFAEELKGQMQGQFTNNLQQDTVSFAQAPAAFADLLASVDKELDTRQQAVETLQASMKQDIEGLVMKLAKERGYTIVFHKYKANIKADDLTQELIQELQKTK